MGPPRPTAIPGNNRSVYPRAVANAIAEAGPPTLAWEATTSVLMSRRSMRPTPKITMPWIATVMLAKYTTGRPTAKMFATTDWAPLLAKKSRTK